MATKKKLNATVIALCTQHKAPEALTKALDELTRLGKGGVSVNVEDVFVVKAKDGKAYLQCSVSNLWMEATVENFYEDAFENNKFGGLKRLSRAVEFVRKKAIGIKKATEKAVMDDLLGGSITREEANKKLEVVAGPDFTGIKGLKIKPV